ncbi:MAG: phosphatidylserine/phosphatidylglycerophosphate/cardiolipin synthase family protein [Bacteriovorax sp.]|jgi:phosphatidylserine/phosphatidylglycerophosphate/cardiolipin synthase-like enzyme
MKKTIMRLGFGILGLISILSLQSCQAPGMRGPSSSGDNELIDNRKIEESYSLQMKLDYLRNEEKKLAAKVAAANKESSTNFDEDELKVVRVKIDETLSKLKYLVSQSQIEADDLHSDVPETQWAEVKTDWRKQKEKLVIMDPNNYALKEGQIVRHFNMDLSGTTDYQLGIVNKFWKPVKKQNNIEDESATDQRRYFEAGITCDGDFKIKKSLFAKSVPKNKNINFRIYEQSNDSPKVILHLNQKVSNCEITFKDPEKAEEIFGVKLVSDSQEDGKIAEIKNRFEQCILPDASKLKGVEKFFLTPKYNSMTCAQEINDIKTLEDPIDGVRAKAETLLGQPLPKDFVITANPYAALDFSKAPKLNAILISYLVFRHDFYGTLIARLAKWHADHGTQVRIINSAAIDNKKDAILLNGMVESSNNIKLQEFRYHSDGGGLWDNLSELHRTMHVKLLITLSDNPADNVVYIGGRNVHDGFVFVKAPDHSEFPEMIQYGSAKGSDEGFAPWRDYEMRIRSKNLARQIASHYMTLWQRDSQSLYVRSINQNTVTTRPADPEYFKRAEDSALVRHFMSIPYKDDQALESLYIDVFDSAEKSVRLSTPYFRPTKKLGEAMERAVARGVQITLITRIDLSGDTAAIILGEVNKAGINRFLNKIKIFEYTEPGVILHSKVILVDGKLSIIGSVNLNKRSFIHDMENGALIYNPAYNKKMHAILDVYHQMSKEVTEKQKIAFWKKVVIGVFDEEF